MRSSVLGKIGQQSLRNMPLSLMAPRSLLGSFAHIRVAIRVSFASSGASFFTQVPTVGRGH